MAKFLPSVQTFVKATAASAVGGATLGAGLLYYGQNYLIYPSGFPPGSRTDISKPMEHNMIYHDVTLTTPDNIRIKAYLMLQRKNVPHTGGTYAQKALDIPAKSPGVTRDIPIGDDMTELDQQISKSHPTVLIFHANAGNMGHRLPLARLFFEHMRCNVFMLSYRGYGSSEGTPSEAGLRIDAQTALDFILDHPLLRSTKILLYGQSIGGAVSIDLASRNHRSVHGLILENTFLSIPELIPTVLPVLSPVSFLCHQIWNSAESITKIPPETPILMLSGLLDEVVPAEHMRRLWDIASQFGTDAKLENVKNNMQSDKEGFEDHPPRYRKEVRGTRRWIEFSNGKHNDTCLDGEYWAEVARFVQTFDKKE